MAAAPWFATELAGRFVTGIGSVLLNVTLKQRRDVKDMAKTHALVTAAQQKLGANGRVLVRWSGTEPKLRVMIEGEDEAQIKAMAEEMIDAAKADLG